MATPTPEEHLKDIKELEAGIKKLEDISLYHPYWSFMNGRRLDPTLTPEKHLGLDKKEE